MKTRHSPIHTTEDISFSVRGGSADDSSVLRGSVRRVLRGNRNQCPSCLEFFNSNSAFDKHRVSTSVGFTPRRCLTTDEMQNLGMLYHEDWWITRLATEAEKVALRALREVSDE